MVNMMKSLMDDFYDLASQSSDFNYRMTMDDAVSLANNCHGLSPMDTLNKVKGDLQWVAKHDSDPQAIEDALLVIQLRRDELI